MNSDQNYQKLIDELIINYLDRMRKFKWGRLSEENTEMGFMDNTTLAGQVFGGNTHFFEKPNVIISDECPNMSFDHSDIHDGIFDLLGQYQLKNGVENQGEIVLFMGCIKKFSKHALQDVNKFLKSSVTFDEIVDLVTRIVLWHELGHWTAHWMRDDSRNRWNNNNYRYDNQQDKMLHEGIAQVFTYWSILSDANSNKLRILFEYLLKGQSEQYHQHITIMQHNQFGWKSFLDALKTIRTYPVPPSLTYLTSAM